MSAKTKEAMGLNKDLRSRMKIYLSADNWEKMIFHGDMAFYHFTSMVEVGESVRGGSAFQKGVAMLQQAYHGGWTIWHGSFRKHYEKVTGESYI